MSRKLQRKENWKRKAEAFLRIAKLNDADRRAEQVLKQSAIESTDSDDSSDSTSSEKADERVMAQPAAVKKDCSLSRGPVMSSDVESAKEAGVPQTCDTSDKSAEKRPCRTEEELAALRAEIRARQKASMERPKLIPKFDQISPLMLDVDTTHYRFNHVAGQQPPLFVMDVQHLLLYAIQGQMASFKPRWCKLARWTKVAKLVVIVIEDLSITDVMEHSESLPFLTSTFQMSIELVSPTQYESSVARELFNVSLSLERFKKRQQAAGKPWKKLAMKPVTAIVVDQADNPVVKEDAGATGRLALLLNSQQMIQEGFPMPVASGYQAEFVFSKESYKPVTTSSPMFALDCEMCLTKPQVLELTHISVINEDLQIVYETLVKPYNPIINYLTKYSGITKEMLAPVQTRLEDVQQTIQGILPEDAILCGQSLNGDMKALQMYHPYVIDTSVIFNLTGHRKIKTSLRELTAKFLGRQIQNDPTGHNPTEDAVATMELVQIKLKHGLHFGDVIVGGAAYAERTADDEPEEAKVSDASDTEELPTKKLKLDSDSDNKCPDDKNKNSSVIETLPKDTESAARKCSISKRKVFFQGPGTTEYESFFPLANEFGRSVILVDREDTTHVQAAQGLTPIETVTKDREVVKHVQEAHGEHFMTCTHLHAYTLHRQEATPSQSTEEVLQKLNKHIKKIVKHLPERSLVTVICGGRTTKEDIQNGICYLHIT